MENLDCLILNAHRVLLTQKNSSKYMICLENYFSDNPTFSSMKDTLSSDLIRHYRGVGFPIFPEKPDTSGMEALAYRARESSRFWFRVGDGFVICGMAGMIYSWLTDNPNSEDIKGISFIFLLTGLVNYLGGHFRKYVCRKAKERATVFDEEEFLEQFDDLKESLLERTAEYRKGLD